MTYKSKCVLVYDLGLFVELAEVLAESFGKVYYTSPGIESPFPKSNPQLIGKGIPGVTRVESIWEVLDDVDLFVFTDVGSGPLQKHLRDIGKRVWGSADAEKIELDRVWAKEALGALGIPIGKYLTHDGWDELLEHLEGRDKQWVKISRNRGDFETFYSEKFALGERRLQRIAYDLDVKRFHTQFITEDNIEDAVEIAYDGYSVDGVYPASAMCGIEVKDKGYIGRFMPYDQLPPQIQDTNEAVAGLLRQMQCRSWFGMEMRITRDGTPYVIDPIARFGSPPGELVQLMYTNLAEILWEGAEGKCVDPESADEWGAEMLIHSGWANTDWECVSIPKADRKNVKLRNLAVIEGRYYVVPQGTGLPEIGAIAATGKTLEEAISRCVAISERVSGYDTHVFKETMDEAKEQMEKLKAFGIDLAAPAPAKKEPAPAVAKPNGLKTRRSK